MPEEKLKTYRLRADLLFQAHGMFHCLGLIVAYFSACRRGNRDACKPFGGQVEIDEVTDGVAAGPSPELRDLRLWHWRQYLHHSSAAEDRRASGHTKREHERTRARHGRAVQALNDLFPAGDTAERDNKPQRALHG